MAVPSPQPKLSPKQAEIRARESRILDNAMPLIRAGGLAAVNMEAIAKVMGVTRGTIYNHFPNKEDILVALASRAVSRRMELFQFATTLGTNPRESCAAIGIAAEVYADHLPDEFAIEQITRHDPVWQKTSPGRREVLAICEQQCIEFIGKVIIDAIQCGDLYPGRGRSHAELSQQLVFGLWSLVYGGLILEATSPSLKSAGITNPRIAIRRNCNALLDNLNWQPLYDARAYGRFVHQISPRLIEHVEEIREQVATIPAEGGS